MLPSRTISCCKILQLKVFFSTLSNFKSKTTITGTLTSTGSSTLCLKSLENNLKYENGYRLFLGWMIKSSILTKSRTKLLIIIKV